MTGTVFSLAGARTRAWAAGAAFALVFAAAPLQAQEADAGETPPADSDTLYELSDPVDSPPVNHRSDVDEEFDTPELHDAEMYAEEYERRQREEKIQKQQQLDRINDFSGGSTTRKGITPDGVAR